MLFTHTLLCLFCGVTLQGPAILAMIWILPVIQRPLRWRGEWLLGDRTEKTAVSPWPNWDATVTRSSRQPGSQSLKFPSNEESLAGQAPLPTSPSWRWDIQDFVKEFAISYLSYQKTPSACWQCMARWISIFRVPGSFHRCSFKIALCFLYVGKHLFQQEQDLVLCLYFTAVSCGSFLC